MSEDLLVSVIMPAYNASSYIREAINSVLSSNYQNIELLIGDDGSTDDTRKIINCYNDPRIRLFINDANLGNLKTWNRLISEAKGEFISFCDADDYISKDKIRKQVDFLTANPGYFICGCNISIVSEKNEVIGDKEYSSDWEKIQKNLLNEYNFPFCAAAVMIRKEVYKTVGGFSYFYNNLSWADHDWLIRCCEKFKASNLPATHYYYRQTMNSITRSYLENDIYKLKAKKIGLQIARYKIETNRDLIEEFDFWKLHEIVLKYEKKYIKSKSILYFDLANSNKDRRKRIFFLKKAIVTNPFRLRYYYHFIRSIL